MNKWIRHPILGFAAFLVLFTCILPYFMHKIIVREEIATASRVKSCHLGTKGCAALIVHFQYDDFDRSYINITIDGKKFHALIDTGASYTLINSKFTGLIGAKKELQDFHGETIPVSSDAMNVCLESICSYENVDIVPYLAEPAILRGAFFDRFHTAKFDYQNRTITLEGWE